MPCTGRSCRLSGGCDILARMTPGIGELNPTLSVPFTVVRETCTLRHIPGISEDLSDSH
jgi:hypothetical protein